MTVFGIDPIRRKICSIATRTVEVPAPDEPVMAIIGCCFDMIALAVTEKHRMTAPSILHRNKSIRRHSLEGLFQTSELSV